MKELSIKNIIDYYGKSDRSRFTFLNKLNVDSFVNKSARNYWHRSLTAISQAFKKNSNQIIIDRIEAISTDNVSTTIRQTKLMYERNIQILNNFKDFDFSFWKPLGKLDFLSQSEGLYTININGLQIKIFGDDLFYYKINDIKYIGGIWFVAKKNGFANEELVLFTDALYRLLKYNFSEEYEIDTSHCMAVDVVKVNAINYTQILNNEKSSKLDSLIEGLKANF
jgi:hypothetical protein